MYIFSVNTVKKTDKFTTDSMKIYFPISRLKATVLQVKGDTLLHTEGFGKENRGLHYSHMQIRSILNQVLRFSQQ